MKKTNENVTYKAIVLKAKELKEGRIVFDMEVNGIKIYGCWFIEYTNKKGEDGTIVSFPSYKGSNGEYYNYAWFPISKGIKEDIKTQLEKLV